MLLIFDLDGTLIDSRLDLAHSVNATRKYMGMQPLPHDTVFSYVGNGAPVLIQRTLGTGATEADLDRALAFFLNYYREHKLDFTVLYPGVREALERLHRHKIPMAVLTNKPVRISEAIVQELGLGEHFKRVYGGNSFEFKKPNAIGITTLMAECGASATDTIMVGDSGVDIQTARNAGVQACGVTYGFQPETFVEFPPDILIDRMEELADRVLGT